MAYQETTVTGYGTRLKGSLKGIVSGIILFIVGTGILWWNEGRTVKTSDANKDAFAETTIVNNIATIDNTLNGKMIHASGLATTKDSLIDPQFNIGVNAIKLIRTVEYYQWVETEKSEKKDKLGGSEETVTTYRYEKKWVSSPQKSASFKDPEYRNKNFTVSNIESETFLAENVAFGAYTLPTFLSKQISGEQLFYVKLPNERIQSLNSSVKSVLQSKTQMLEKPYQANGEYVHISSNEIYLGANANDPVVGDVRITFHKVMPANVTVWAKVINNTFEAYQCDNGYSVSALKMGTQSLDRTFQEEQEDNSSTAWILRLIGVVFIVFGLRGMFGILVILLKVVPFLSDIMSVGVNLVCILVGLIWSFLIIAIAWIFYRPILAIALLLAAGALIFFLIKRSKANKQESSESNTK